MSSRPIVRVVVGGDDMLPGEVLEVTIDAPEGAASLTCTIKFAGPRPGLLVETHILIQAGHAGDVQLEDLFDSDLMQSSTFEISPRSDQLTVTWECEVSRFRKRAPLEREVWEGTGKTLRQFVKFIAEKCGYLIVHTNVPKLRMPAEVPILPEKGYWQTMVDILAPLRPQILPDDIGGKLYVWWLDALVPGQPLELPIKKAEGVSIPKVVRERVNVALLKYLIRGNDGGRLRLDCAALGATFDDPTDLVAGITTAACSVEIDPEADAELVERVSRDPAPPAAEGEGETIVERRDRYAVLYDEEGNVVGTPVLTRRVSTAYATDGIVELGPVHRTTTTYKFIKGTNYQHSAGHTSVTEGRMPIPLAGDLWIDNLYTETEEIVYLVYKTGDLEKYRSIRKTRGWVLEPDHVPLYEAATNRAVRTGEDTYQWATSDQALTWEVEELSPLGGSTSYARRQFNYLTGLWEGPGDDGDSPGAIPKTSDLAPRTFEETYTDPALGGEEPEDGWQVPVEIDGTWIGTGKYEIRGEDPLTARDWCIRMADAMFRRAGKRTTTYTATYAKYLSKVRRGASVLTSKRDGEHEHVAVVVAHTYKWEWVPPVGASAGGYKATTTLSARRMEGIGPGLEA